MGGFIGKHEVGLLEADDDQSQFSSPPTVAAAASRHFLPHELDPRSPSDGIDRTPIPVPAAQETVADPRSPSAGIVRTPIVCLPADSGDISVDVLPVSECVDTKQSEPSLIPHMDLDNSEISEDVNACVSMSTDSPKTEAVSDKAAAGARSEKVSNNHPVPYALSPASNKLFESRSTSQRSPLAPRNFVAPRDSSTPRNIILRKQSAHVEKLRGLDVPASEKLTTKRQQQQMLQSSWDKENL